MFQIILTSEAKKEINKIKELLQGSLIDAFNELRENPYSGKPLSDDLSGYFSYKIGVFRLIYKIKQKDKLILIITAGHRSTVYQ